MKKIILSACFLFLLFIPFRSLAQFLTTAFSPPVQCYSPGGNSATGMVVNQPPGAASYTWQVTSPGACPPPNISSFAPDNSLITVYFTCCGIYTIDCIALDGSNMFIDANTTTVEISCGSSISLNTLPSTSVFCTGSSATLSASGASSYTWLPGSSNGSSLVVSAGGCYTVMGSGSGSCVAEAVSCVTLQTVNFSLNPLTQTVCAATNATLIAAGANSYLWNTGATTNSIVVSPTVSTTYTITGGFGNCTVEKTASVNVTAPTLSVTGNVPVLCRGKSATLTASGASTYTWSNSAATVSFIVISPTITTTYTVTGKDAAGCTAKATKTQSVTNCVGLEETGNKAVSAIIYPNPTRNKITLANKGEEEITLLEIYNAHGQLVLFKKGNFDVLEIDLSDYPVGLFFVRLESKDGVGIYKLIKSAD